ncbi:SCAN domain-containing protein 3 [Bactrocera dorsalis]|uniref:SCAN domain-containing protein 3 n=1 Tax=Bactrocera dorsalis TaxID=27457 RepID=A0A6J0RIK8_BACDO|nr:SCAN domain-containing protein 3 [Bactrocera dorsalis]
MFNDDWETDFLFTQNSIGEPICLICQRNVKRNHKYNIERHYRTCHKEYINMEADTRANLIAELKKRIIIEEKQESDNFEQLNVKKASFVITLALAKRCRPFDDAVFFKELATEVMCCFGREGKEMAKVLEKVPLSKNTMTRRTGQISSHIFSLTKKRIDNCKYFSLCLQVSTDINNKSHLIICIKSVDDKLITSEEMMNVVTLHDNVNGEQIMEALEVNVFNHVDINKLSAVCTDGGIVMLGNEEELEVCLLKRTIYVPIFHCIIHQQALLRQDLCLHNAMDFAVEMIQKIKDARNALNQKKFKSLLDELDADHEDLLVHSDVRWLSKGKCLQRLFNLRKDVLIFFGENVSPDVETFVAALKDRDFIADLAFLCDITQFINDLNLLLQGKNKNIFDLVRTLTLFKRKFEILLNEIKNYNISNLPNLAQIFHDNTPFYKIDMYTKTIETLLQDFSHRFQDFDVIKQNIDLHDNPLTCDIQAQKIELQMELARMREDFQISTETGVNFWKKANDAVYPLLKNEIYKLYSMFGSMHNCEAVFATMKLLLSKHGHRMTDKHIADIIRIKTYENDIDIHELALSTYKLGTSFTPS